MDLGTPTPPVTSSAGGPTASSSKLGEAGAISLSNNPVSGVTMLGNHVLQYCSHLLAEKLSSALGNGELIISSKPRSTLVPNLIDSVLQRLDNCLTKFGELQSIYRGIIDSQESPHLPALDELKKTVVADKKLEFMTPGLGLSPSAAIDAVTSSVKSVTNLIALFRTNETVVGETLSITDLQLNIMLAAELTALKRGLKCYLPEHMSVKESNSVIDRLNKIDAMRADLQKMIDSIVPSSKNDGTLWIDKLIYGPDPAIKSAKVDRSILSDLKAFQGQLADFQTQMQVLKDLLATPLPDVVPADPAEALPGAQATAPPPPGQIKLPKPSLLDVLLSCAPLFEKLQSADFLFTHVASTAGANRTRTGLLWSRYSHDAAVTVEFLLQGAKSDSIVSCGVVARAFTDIKDQRTPVKNWFCWNGVELPNLEKFEVILPPPTQTQSQ